MLDLKDPKQSRQKKSVRQSEIYCFDVSEIGKIAIGLKSGDISLWSLNL
jgi:hypothetical protein